jgi:hypothetical protein
MSGARLIGPEDVVGVEEIADRLGLELAEAERVMRKPTFPTPATELTIGPLWLWPDVKTHLDGPGWMLAVGALYIARRIAHDGLLPGTDSEGHFLARELAHASGSDAIAAEVDALLPEVPIDP